MSLYFPTDQGGVVAVEATCYRDDQRNRPVSAYIIGAVSRDLQRTVEYGAAVAYDLLRQHEGGKIGTGYTIAFELTQKNRDRELVGESGGLACALACYAELTGVPFAVDIGATGKLAGVKNGSVDKIDGLEKKMLGLAEVLVPGAKIFYPKANAPELEPSLLARLQGQGFSCHGVDSVGDALAVLGAGPNVSSAGKGAGAKLMLVWGGILIAVTVLAAAIILQQHKIRSSRVGAADIVTGSEQILQQRAGVKPVVITSEQENSVGAVALDEEKTTVPSKPTFSQGFE